MTEPTPIPTPPAPEAAPVPSPSAPDTAPDLQHAAPASDEYRVNLDLYSGPLELLLYLIRRDEVDIRDIPIARITQQYLQYIDVIRRVDINLAGEFLVMAATLMEIKSRMLIPAAPVDPNAPEGSTTTSVEDLTDPRYELVKQLLEYKHFKDAASELRRRQQTESARYPRGVSRPAGAAPLDIEDLDLFRLIDAFNAIMSSIGHSAFGHEVLYDDTPISLHQADILDRLARETGKVLSFRAMFAGREKKSEVIGLFLATLELIRQKKVTIDQNETSGEMQITLCADEGQILFAEEAASPTAAPLPEAAATSEAAPADVPPASGPAEAAPPADTL